jgi:integrase
MMKVRLDAKTIPNLAPGKGRKEVFAWDTEIEGFGCRVWQGAGKLQRSFVVQYRAGGHTRRITIGSAAKLTPIQARETARKLLARIALGHDPQAEKETSRRQAAHTFRSVATSYLEARQSELRPTTYSCKKLYLTGSYFRPLHPMAVGAITRADVSACVRAISSKHSAHTAGAARRVLSAFFAWSTAEGLLGNGANPVIGSYRPLDNPARNRVLTDAELVAIWRACSRPGFEQIIRLLILLGSRRGEVGGMCWSELDLEAGIWSLPIERSKNKRAHTLPLPPAALAIIDSVPKTDRDRLFGDYSQKGFTGWVLNKAILDDRVLGVVETWRIHDLRRTVATRMADIGIEPHVIEAVLNHFSGHRSGAAGVYNRSDYKHAVRAALARWSDHVLSLVEGRESTVVIPMRA